MSIIVKIFACSLIALLGFSCSQKEQLITDAHLRKSVQDAFGKTVALASHRATDLFNVFDEELTEMESDALKFLYAYMPLSDLADYDGKFYLNHAQYALKTKREFSWGVSVPADLFLHYVLPVRVNNEYLDTARMVFYHELKDRVKNLTMMEAALEVNHWCHEKVTYRSTDEYRTSAPLSTVNTAFGRCGEQSVFTVAAMRAVGIPARQIYTPRWVHTDDNHAWVEVWVDGKWYFLGACEPEPELNMGWFDGPATRAMLLHNRSYGNMLSAPEVVCRTAGFTEVNVLKDYADTHRLAVKVVDEAGLPVKDATVLFQVVNFAEFFSIATISTDQNGLVELLTGNGDLMLYAEKNGHIAYQKVSVPVNQQVTLTLQVPDLNNRVESFMMRASSGKEIPSRDVGDRTAHQARLHHEDALRSAYEQTFIDSASVVNVARDINIDNAAAWQIMRQTRGNWLNVLHFLQYAGNQYDNRALALLSVVAAKDLRDTPFEVFADHWNNTPDVLARYPQQFQHYVLNPRIRNEKITAYKAVLQQVFGSKVSGSDSEMVTTVLKWINENVEVRNDANYWNVPISPVGVLNLRVADCNSRDIFFVAVMRSLGLPARIEQVRLQPQVLLDALWVDVDIEAASVQQKPAGILVVNYEAQSALQLLPKYYSQFTIARFDGASFVTLDYSGSDVFSNFPATLTVDAGFYSLVSGLRLPDGSFSTRRHFFMVDEGQKVNVLLEIPLVEAIAANIDVEIDLNRTVEMIPTGELVNLSKLANGEGIALIWIDPAREPTRHIINDLLRLKNSLDRWPGHFVLLIAPGSITPGFSQTAYSGLPTRTLFVKDAHAWLEQIGQSSDRDFSGRLPAVFLINNQGELIFQSSGYRIGIGDDILNQLHTHCKLTN